MGKRGRTKSHQKDNNGSSNNSFKLQLTLQAKDLKTVGGMLRSSSNPSAEVRQIEDGLDPVLLGKTEVIQSSVNPVWMKTFYLQYTIGKPMNIDVSVFHNATGDNIKSMGSATFEIGDVLGSRGQKAKKLKQGGMLIIRAIKAPLRSSGNLVLCLQGSRLRNFERTGVSDPFFEISRNGSKEHPWLPVFRSNIVLSTLDPIWEPASVDLDRLCDGNKDMEIMISLYDFEKNGKHKRMGHFKTTVNTLLKEKVNGNKNESIRSFTLTKDKETKKGEKKDYGKVIVSDAFIETMEENKTQENNKSKDVDDPNERYLHITLHGIDIIGTKNAIFEFSRFIDTGSTSLIVMRSPHISNSTNPKWKPVSIPMSKLCDNDKSKPISVSIYDYNGKKETVKKRIGQFETSVDALLAAKSSDPNDEEKLLILSSNAGKNVGKIQVVDASINKTGEVSQVVPETPPVVASRTEDNNETPSNLTNGDVTEPQDAVELENQPPLESQIEESPIESPPTATPRTEDVSEATFLDYINGGCELQLCIAIDFGSSNGPYKSPTSLHKLHSDGKLNDYETAIKDIGSILSKYCGKGPGCGIPVWGFGAKIGGMQQSCFTLGAQAEANDVDEALGFYRNFFSFKFSMSSKAIATDVIDNAGKFAKWELDERLKQNEQCYTVLLLFTDGDLSSISKTREVIANAGKYPLSIVIVGIGNGDFSDMQLLDEFMEDSGVKTARDITQFVEFNAHRSTKDALSNAVLEEIPDQVVEYFTTHNIDPNPPVYKDVADIEADDYDEVTEIKSEVDNDEGGSGFFSKLRFGICADRRCASNFGSFFFEY